MTSVPPGPATRWAVAPGTDGELTQTLATLEEVLVLLQPVDISEAALPNTGPDELHAVQNICMRIFAAERSGAPQLYAPDGKFEYVPLFFFQLLEEDLAAVGRAVAQLGRALLPGGDIEMREALRGQARDGQTCEDLVVSFAQAHGVLDLEPDEDSAIPCRGPGRRTGPGRAQPGAGRGVPAVRRALPGAALQQRVRPLFVQGRLGGRASGAFWPGPEPWR